MNISTENITTVEAEKFRKWLHDPNYDVLLKILRSRQMVHEANVANHMMKSTEAGDNAARGERSLALNCRETILSLNLIRDKEEFKISKATPTQ